MSVFKFLFSSSSFDRFIAKPFTVVAVVVGDGVVCAIASVADVRKFVGVIGDDEVCIVICGIGGGAAGDVGVPFRSHGKYFKANAFMSTLLSFGMIR